MTSTVTKAVILARGLGTRMRANDGSPDPTHNSAAVNAGAKGMIDVGRPFLDFVISALADVGITDVCLVIGPEHNIFRDYYDNLELKRVRIHYAIQAEPLGTANALAAAAEFTGQDRVVVLNSDNYYPIEALKSLVELPGAGVVGFEREALIAKSNIPAERIAAFAVISVDEQGNLSDIIEKPSPAELERLGSHAPISMNAWLFTADIFPACADVDKSVRGEYELVDAVRLARSRGRSFRVPPAAQGVLDMSRRTDIDAVRQALSHTQVSL